MPTVTVTAAVVAKRRGSAGLGSGSEYRHGRQWRRSQGSAVAVNGRLEQRRPKMQAGVGKVDLAGLIYGRQRLCGARAAESSSVRARSCRALACAGGGSGYGGGKGSKAQGHKTNPSPLFISLTR